jgi:hypothetical protein
MAPRTRAKKDIKNIKNMTSKSPDRHTFQMNNYVKRQEEQGLEPLEEYIAMFKTWQQQDEVNLVDPEWQKNNMEYDLRSTAWILEKVRNSEVYAQNLYAAMCNNDFQKLDVWPILKDERWSCSWRHSGGIVADMREQGDYVDWYCSGIGVEKDSGYVSEGTVTDEIHSDLQELGWRSVDQKEPDL